MKAGSSPRIFGLMTVLLMVGAGLAFIGVAVDEFSRRGFEYAVIALLGEGVLFAMLAFGPVGKGIAALLNGENEGDPAAAARMLDLEDRINELSGEVQRVADLEARLEFAERLLTNPAIQRLGRGDTPP